MSASTPFHPRTLQLCQSLKYKDWAGFHAVCRYQHGLGFEYTAFRNRAGLLDISPLFKVRIRGRDAARLLDRLTPREVSRRRVGQVLYTPWCDDQGKVIDDGTIQRLDAEDFRLTSAYPNLGWLEDVASGLSVSLEDESESTAALSLQGPFSRAVLEAAGAEGVSSLRYFRLCQTRIGEVPVTVSRTGYTGDLGFEIWMDRHQALTVWDALIEHGAAFGITPAGLDALDLARLEAGLILIDVDYHNARQAVLEVRKSSPFEIGLGWCVSRTKESFYVGQAALAAERRNGPARGLVGLEIDWPQVEALFEAEGLPPAVPEGVSREPVPVYDHGQQVGRATSRAFSPILKKGIALATLEARAIQPGTRLEIETTVEYQRKTVTATVVPRPFFDPPRKKAQARADGSALL